MRHNEVRALFELLGLHIPSADIFFEILSTGLQRKFEGEEPCLPIEDIVDACMNLKGGSKNIDVLTILMMVEHMLGGQREIKRMCKRTVSKISAAELDRK